MQQHSLRSAGCAERDIRRYCGEGGEARAGGGGGGAAGAEQSERLLRIRERELVLRERELALEERELAVWLGLYPIVTSQYSSTNLYQVSYHI
jgi:hypothetical protein